MMKTVKLVVILSVLGLMLLGGSCLVAGEETIIFKEDFENIGQGYADIEALENDINNEESEANRYALVDGTLELETTGDNSAGDVYIPLKIPEQTGKFNVEFKLKTNNTESFNRFFRLIGDNKNRILKWNDKQLSALGEVILDNFESNKWYIFKFELDLEGEHKLTVENDKGEVVAEKVFYPILEYVDKIRFGLRDKNSYIVNLDDIKITNLDGEEETIIFKEDFENIGQGYADIEALENDINNEESEANRFALVDGTLELETTGDDSAGDVYIPLKIPEQTGKFNIEFKLKTNNTESFNRLFRLIGDNKNRIIKWQDKQLSALGEVILDNFESNKWYNFKFALDLGEEHILTVENEKGKVVAEKVFYPILEYVDKIRFGLRDKNSYIVNLDDIKIYTVE